MKRLAGYLAKWVGAILLWLLFVYQITLPELLAGAVGGALTVFALETSRKAEPLHFRPKLLWYLQLWRMPAMIVKDFGLLLQSLARHAQRKPSEALFQMARFRTSGNEDHQAAQRCLATACMSLPPNSVVVDIDTERELMMFHGLKKAPVPVLIRKLEEE